MYDTLLDRHTFIQESKRATDREVKHHFSKKEGEIDQVVQQCELKDQKIKILEERIKKNEEIYEEKIAF